MKKNTVSKKADLPTSDKLSRTPAFEVAMRREQEQIAAALPTFDNAPTAAYWENRPLADIERDWKETTENWVSDYWASKSHPHRNLILNALTTFEFTSLGEVGCNAGPNLSRIATAYPSANLKGIDVSPLAIEAAKQYLGTYSNLEVASALRLPWDTQSIDILLYDAVLMYVDPENIKTAMDELARVTRKGVILVERYSKEDALVGHVWGRDYKTLLEERGFHVQEIAITKESWPTSLNWQKHGRTYVARTPSGTSGTN